MSILDLLSAAPGEDRPSGKIYGVAIAVVTNNKDPEKLGRVKLKLPWLSEDTESDWARIAVPMAGKDRGLFYLPEVDDEVLVAFEHGDPGTPYVIGALWNGKDTPPRDNADGKNDLRVFKSRSGHELVFSDASGKEQVEIKTKAGHQVLLDDTSGSEKITIKDKSGNNKIEIDSVQNAVSIAGQMKLSIKAQMVEIEADTMLKIKAGATLTIQGTMVQIN